MIHATAAKSDGVLSVTCRADTIELPYICFDLIECRVTTRKEGSVSVLEDVLEEEYARSSRLLGLMEQEIGLLPKGSIRMRNIKGHEYCYLNYRVGDKVKSDYVPASEVDELRAKIERRRSLAAAIREQKRSQKQIIRALGRVPNVD